jgi:hypothetical protein
VAGFSLEGSAASCCQVIGPNTPSKELIMASAMDVDDEEIELPTSSSGKGEKKRFEVKKVNIKIFPDSFYFCLRLCWY